MEVAAEIVNLKDWYFNELPAQQKKARSHTKYLFGGIKFILFLVIGLLLIITIKFLVYWFFVRTDPYASDFYSPFPDFEQPHDRRLSNEIWFLTLGLSIVLLYSTIGWFIYLLAWEKINLFDSLKEKKRIFQITPVQASMLTDIVAELALKMKIDVTKVQMWGIINRDKYPSIEKISKGILIY